MALLSERVDGKEDLYRWNMVAEHYRSNMSFFDSKDKGTTTRFLLSLPKILDMAAVPVANQFFDEKWGLSQFRDSSISDQDIFRFRANDLFETAFGVKDFIPEPTPS